VHRGVKGVGHAHHHPHSCVAPWGGLVDAAIDLGVTAVDGAVITVIAVDRARRVAFTYDAGFDAVAEDSIVTIFVVFATVYAALVPGAELGLLTQRIVGEVSANTAHGAGVIGARDTIIAVGIHRTHSTASFTQRGVVLNGGVSGSPSAGVGPAGAKGEQAECE